MFSLHGIFDGKPDHSMFDAKEAGKLLADLPKDDAFKALRWEASFRPECKSQSAKLLC